MVLLKYANQDLVDGRLAALFAAREHMKATAQIRLLELGAGIMKFVNQGRADGILIPGITFAVWEHMKATAPIRPLELGASIIRSVLVVFVAIASVLMFDILV
jgi:hypothetical protein